MVSIRIGVVRLAWEICVAVRIRLKRLGRRHRATYRIAAVDSRKARDSAVIEELGIYDPAHPSPDQRVKLNRERIQYWIGVGAQPSDTVRKLISKETPAPATA